MPEEQIPLDDQHQRPASASSSGPRSRQPSVGELQDANGPADGGGGHFVAIRNMLNATRNRPVARIAPLEPSFVPAPQRYFPIVIPAEPTIEELLRQAAGTQELATVHEIKLKVISHLTSLQRIPCFIPQLRSLILEGSIVMTLRDLGCDMTFLRHLNVSRCSLKHLDGTTGLESLEELVADYNLIEEVGPCTNLINIKKISLKGNRITDVGSVTFLALCEKLEVLDLRENFVSEDPSFWHVLKTNIPQLRCLNGTQFREVASDETDLSSSDYRSSSSGSIEDVRRGRWEAPTVSSGGGIVGASREIGPRRPITASVERRVTVELLDQQRPSTADPVKIKAQLTSGEPVVGSVVTKARRRRRQRTAWGESTSCSSVSSSDSSFTKDFPDRLPQKAVDLELGVIGVASAATQGQSSRAPAQRSQHNEHATANAATAAADDDDDDDPQSLLRAARLWRQRSLQTRETIREQEQLLILRQLNDEE
uniref:U2A'/phosphoprotein 32 family A C-terminal domain-containing protein n=1 Tax=Anopheles farauti TaxID=69004 RepID=A0A182QKL9_9DIPT